MCTMLVFWYFWIHVTVTNVHSLWRFNKISRSFAFGVIFYHCVWLCDQLSFQVAASRGHCLPSALPQVVSNVCYIMRVEKTSILFNPPHIGRLWKKHQHAFVFYVISLCSKSYDIIIAVHGLATLVTKPLASGSLTYRNIVGSTPHGLRKIKYYKYKQIIYM